jgi:hypothetical protein
LRRRSSSTCRKLTEHQTVRTRKEATPDISLAKHSTYRTKKEYKRERPLTNKGKPIRITADFFNTNFKGMKVMKRYFRP